MSDYSDYMQEYDDEEFQDRPEPDADDGLVAASSHDGEMTVSGTDQAVQALGESQRPPARADGGDQATLDEWGSP